MNYYKCVKCDHFVDGGTHLDDGEKDHTHQAIAGIPGKTLRQWKKDRPDLFREHPDGKIGPNSRFHSRSKETNEY